jgi:hypothetical protein
VELTTYLFALRFSCKSARIVLNTPKTQLANNNIVVNSIAITPFEVRDGRASSRSKVLSSGFLVEA